MKAAMEAVGKGQSISRASLNHGVPKTTLGDLIHGRVQHGITYPEMHVCYWT